MYVWHNDDMSGRQDYWEYCGTMFHFVWLKWPDCDFIYFMSLNNVRMGISISGYWNYNMTLLPSEFTKQGVYEMYRKSCEDAEKPPVALSSFKNVWNSLVPYIIIAKPATDLCWTCQQNNTLIFRYVLVLFSFRLSTYRYLAFTHI